MNRVTDYVWGWLACKLLLDAVFTSLVREDFDEEAFGEASVIWPTQQTVTVTRPLTPAVTTMARS